MVIESPGTAPWARLKLAENVFRRHPGHRDLASATVQDYQIVCDPSQLDGERCPRGVR